jgi:hypothetical protein
MRRLIFCLAVVLAIVAPSVTFSPTHAVAAKSTPVAQGDLQLFATEDAAQKHCPRDEVVWLNLPSGIYHEKGMRWYGRTKHGAYVCRKEAAAAGDRNTRNGQ